MVSIQKRNVVKENRRGYFKTTRIELFENPEIMMVVFSHMVITDVEHHGMRNETSYYAFSPLFEMVENECPEYRIVIETEPDIKVTATKI